MGRGNRTAPIRARALLACDCTTEWRSPQGSDTGDDSLSASETPHVVTDIPPALPAELRVKPLRGDALPNGTPILKTASEPADNHVRHARDHLQRLEQGLAVVEDPFEVFLARDDTDLFWELIGFRLTGHPGLIFGAVRFRKHDFPGIEFGRESLAAYLSAPSASLGQPGLDSPPGMIPVLLPRVHETIPTFLKGIQAGRKPCPIYIEPSTIRVAFDLRMYNPSGLENFRQRAGPLQKHLFRTLDGHVLRGLSHGAADGPNRLRTFVAIKDAEQLTPRGRYRLPMLAIRRSFLTLTAEAGNSEAGLAAPNWVPFVPATAHAAHLLLG